MHAEDLPEAGHPVPETMGGITYLARDSEAATAIRAWLTGREAYFVALFCNSPYRDGQITQYHSVRTLHLLEIGDDAMVAGGEGPDVAIPWIDPLPPDLAALPGDLLAGLFATEDLTARLAVLSEVAPRDDDPPALLAAVARDGPHTGIADGLIAVPAARLLREARDGWLASGAEDRAAALEAFASAFPDRLRAPADLALEDALAKLEAEDLSHLPLHEESPEPHLVFRMVRPAHHQESFAQFVAHALLSPRTLMAPRFLYDARGSRLFERICDLPEYYLTRAETRILETSSATIAGLFQGPIELIELGSGSSTKTRILIEALLAAHHDLHYMPIDISRSMLLESAHDLITSFPALRVTGMVSEYATALANLPDAQRPRLVVFLGSSIGNLEPVESIALLRRIRRALAPGDRLLLGTDLQKDPAILVPAYDDAQGVTASFTLNLLGRMNRELGADFDVTGFAHQAAYDPIHGRMEMSIRSLRDQMVTIPSLDLTVDFSAGETIPMEYSYKYTAGGTCRLATLAGFRIADRFLDDRGWFALNVLEPIDG